jgi:alpha-galactosidase
MKSCLLVLGLAGVACLNNGVGRTPPMGYNTWNDYRCDIDAADIQQSAAAMVKLNLTSLGYNYINVRVRDCQSRF